jgi:hypothetical protein
MPYILASAQNIDASVSTLTLVLISMGIVLAVALAAIVPLVIASRGHRQPESVIAFTILWACLTAASLIYVTMTQMKWGSERDLRIKTGYYDPQQATNDGPPLPAGQWTALGIGYAALVGWAFARRARS